MFDQFVQDQPGLELVCQHLRQEPWVALDTEFVRERTYYARLCLIQIATPDRLFCVDPLAIDDLSALLDVVYDSKIVKVLHSARQDLEVFYDLRGAAPAPVFDTQIAAALLGYEDQIGYATLVEQLIGVKLDKLHTRTDWSIRPLNIEQLDYAADDVRYLSTIYHQLTAKLNELGRSDWVSEECTRLTEPGLYANDPDYAYERIKKGRTLFPANQQVLRALAGWREHTAKTRNLPRSWVLRDATLLELAATQPTSREQLKNIKGIGAATLRKWGDDMLKTIADGQTMAPSSQWHKPIPLTRAQIELSRRMLALVKSCADEQGISPALLATRKDVQALIRGERNIALLTGWRRQVVGETLLKVLEAAP
jgi:ribonuclease D